MIKTRFICNVCGYESQKWYGRCPECSNWNTFEEVEVQDEKKKDFSKQKNYKEEKLSKISQIKTTNRKRISTGFEEFDRVLGGGVVSGEVILLSGDPGIGKSTLLLELSLNISKTKTVFYISGEESEDQIKMRTDRIADPKTLVKNELYLLSSSNIDAIIELLKDKKPDLVIVDSIQTMESEQLSGFPGSIPQLRYSTSAFTDFAKSYGIPVFLIGHVTKEGVVAGPMLLSHMVDCVLYLEGEDQSEVRILRAFKNRFGDASEVGIFAMQEKGLAEIKDVNSFFVDKNDDKVPGSCITVAMEGSRPILVEIQALVVPSSLTFPRRVVNGINQKRVELLLAVIQKHVKLPLDRLDVFINVVGGLRIYETACDLAICLSIVSSFKNVSLPGIVAISEVGLLGELRNVINLEKRVNEAKKLGFDKAITSKNKKFLNDIINEVIK